MLSIPAGTKIASRMTGINTPAKTVIVRAGQYTTNDYKIESDDYITGWNG
jgi:hypothetical protein